MPRRACAREALLHVSQSLHSGRCKDADFSLSAEKKPLASTMQVQRDVTYDLNLLDFRLKALFSSLLTSTAVSSRIQTLAMTSLLTANCFPA